MVINFAYRCSCQGNRSSEVLGICSGFLVDGDRTFGFIATRKEPEHLNNMWSETTPVPWTAVFGQFISGLRLEDKSRLFELNLRNSNTGEGRLPRASYVCTVVT